MKQKHTKKFKEKLRVQHSIGDDVRISNGFNVGVTEEELDGNIDGRED